jgi:hypothetical protein
VESQNGGSRWERTNRKRSPHEGSYRERHHKEKSHQERQHREKSQHDESRYNHYNEKVKDLKKKYAHILSRMDVKDPKTTAWDMLDDESLPFSERVRAYCNTPSPLRLGLSHFFFYNKIFAKIHKFYQST